MGSLVQAFLSLWGLSAQSVLINLEELKGALCSRLCRDPHLQNSLTPIIKEEQWVG